MKHSSATSFPHNNTIVLVENDKHEIIRGIPFKSVTAYENYAVGIYGVTPLNIFPEFKFYQKMKKISYDKNSLKTRNLFCILPRFVMEKFKVYKLQLSFSFPFSHFLLFVIIWMIPKFLTQPNSIENVNILLCHFLFSFYHL